MKELLSMSQKEIDRAGIIQQVSQKLLRQKEAAEILNLSNRQVRRLTTSFRKHGAKGLTHGLRGKLGNRRSSDSFKEKTLQIVREKYFDFGPKFASEKLDEIDRIKISSDSLRRWMINVGLWKAKQRKVKQHFWRERKDHFGQMVQFDGSHHKWFEQRASKCVLLASRDDATNTTDALFVSAESTIEVFKFWQQYILKYGKPKSIYLDRHSIYKTVRPVQMQGEELDLTQFERAMEELNIEVIHAHSPQAKGRIENVFGTLQDRLVKELRLANIQSIDQANIFLKNIFLPKFDQKFSIPSKQSANLHRRLNREEKQNLLSIFSIHQQRYINNDFTIRFKNKWLQLEKIQPMLVLPGNSVLIEEHLDKSTHLKLKEKYLNFTIINKRPIHKFIAIALTSNPKPRVYAKPAQNHPWRRFTIANARY